MSAAFTPGPWHFDGAPDNHIVWSSSDNRVCFLASNGPTTANAHLIAAAPEFYEAVRLFLAYDAGDETDGVALMLAYNDALTAAKAAYAKARGESPHNQSNPKVGV